MLLPKLTLRPPRTLEAAIRQYEKTLGRRLTERDKRAFRAGVLWEARRRGEIPDWYEAEKAKAAKLRPKGRPAT